MKRNHKHQTGFSLVELVVVMFIFSFLFIFITVALLNIKHQSSLVTSIDTLITDLKSQQLKAMVGDTEGRVDPDTYGIYFGSNQYTLFHGTYSPSDSSNFVVTLGDNIQFGTISFPASLVSFAQDSGEVVGAESLNTIIVQNTQTNERKAITINKYGVVTAINQI